MTLGSLFDGSGGFPLAASLVGITPIWASEIAPYPIAVTRSRFPAMKHYGDICRINGAEIEPVDIITFGSPCQDLSVAGNRAGLGGARSGLFMEAVRVIKEMREATNGKYPRYALWENVPGAFSSNNGEDFRTVLEELIKIAEPAAVMPPIPPGGWAYADCYVGDGWSLAYRVFDAQHWGVPQRRRRIHLVCDFAGHRAGEVLFKREGLQGYLKARGEAGEGTSGTAVDSALPASPAIPIHAQATRHRGMGGRGKGNGLGVGKPGDPANTLTAGEQHAVCYRPLSYGEYIEDRAAANLRAQGDEGGEALIRRGSIVRRLTPTECARLQGFPDCWGHPDRKTALTDEEYDFWLDVRMTHAQINGKQVKHRPREQMLKWYNSLHTDAAEYKMWGNGIALPPALYCMEGFIDGQ